MVGTYPNSLKTVIAVNGGSTTYKPKGLNTNASSIFRLNFFKRSSEKLLILT